MPMAPLVAPHLIHIELRFSAVDWELLKHGIPACVSKYGRWLNPCRGGAGEPCMQTGQSGWLLVPGWPVSEDPEMFCPVDAGQEGRQGVDGLPVA